MFFDPMYLLFMVPGMILAAWAQWKVHAAYQEASRIAPASGATGAEAAAVILRQSGLRGVEIEQTEGIMSDHYDPSAKVLRLSPDVYHGRSLAAVGIAAHEAGHALQDAQRYPLLVLRNGIVPLASIGGNLSWILLMAGFLLQSFNLIIAGIVAFSITVVFQLINLPVEFDASRRAKAILSEMGIVRGPEEIGEVRRVLSAAAMTYVAATLMAMLNLVYYLFRAGLFGGSRDEEA
ncbi:MAG TPA: zinc metallopeptidase [Planctomycetota bacterium]|nr:zinc metallopeptidase [Planctomycetota bacterium]